MQNLIDLSKKSKRIVAGLMSGTSVDGTDVALVEIDGSGIDSKINLLGYLEHPFPTGMKELILKNSIAETSRVDEISQLNFLISKVYADAVKRLCGEIEYPMENIDLIGSHGQTIHHLPIEDDLFGYNVASTLQIGDPAVIAKLTGIVTVGDFRTGDVALGGEGAPLVPYFDYILFHSNRKNRALLNIGGISNITFISKGSEIDDIFAFDTGPGNMLIDYTTKLLFNLEFDEDGKHAESGSRDAELFDALVKKDNFIERDPPKSTGREYYGPKFIHDLFGKFDHVPKENLLNTITEFTAYGIFRNYEKYIMPRYELDELYISGGGAKNKFLYKLLDSYFQNKVEIKIIDEIGISSDAKEAICFALLANETISGNPTNIPRTTGASRSTILGKICLP